MEFDTKFGNLCDIVVVGAGLSGLYTCYRLIKQDPHIRIGVIEKSAHVGGKLKSQTCTFTNNNPLFLSFLNDLDIPLDTVCEIHEDIMAAETIKLDSKEQAFLEKHDKHIPTAISLLRFALENILDKQWNIENIDSFGNDMKHNKLLLKKFATYKNMSMKYIGIYDLLKDVLSFQALDLITDFNNVCRLIKNNLPATEYLGILLDMTAHYYNHEHLNIIKNDNKILLQNIENALQNNVDYKFNDTINSIKYLSDRKIIKITLTSQQSILCKNIIFTIPPKELLSIKQIPFQLRKTLSNNISIEFAAATYLLDSTNNKLQHHPSIDTIYHDDRVIIKGLKTNMETFMKHTNSKTTNYNAFDYNFLINTDAIHYGYSLCNNIIICNTAHKINDDTNVYYISKSLSYFTGYIDYSLYIVEKIIHDIFTT